MALCPSATQSCVCPRHSPDTAHCIPPTHCPAHATSIYSSSLCSSHSYFKLSSWCCRNQWRLLGSSLGKDKGPLHSFFCASLLCQAFLQNGYWVPEDRASGGCHCSNDQGGWRRYWVKDPGGSWGVAAGAWAEGISSCTVCRAVPSACPAHWAWSKGQ